MKEEFEKLVKANEFIDWFIVLLIILAETILTFVSILMGLIFYFIILISFITAAIMEKRECYHLLYTALCLVPLIRIISVSLPLTGIPEVYRMVAVSVPLFVTGIMIAAFVGIQPKVMGFKISKLHKQLVIALLGLPLGFAEFYLIQPDLTKISITPKEIITWVITLIICVGLLEEFLFRGILFNVAYKSLSNNKAIYFTSLLYAAMTISSKSLLNVINALLISILFCRLLIRSKSIIGISLAHGIINITYYLICPHIF